MIKIEKIFVACMSFCLMFLFNIIFFPIYAISKIIDKEDEEAKARGASW